MKSIFVLLFCVSFWCNSQVGINTTTPNAQLHIQSSNQANPTNTDGILIPKIDTFPAVNPTAAQQGMLVYLTTTTGTDAPGFYFWDNTTTDWQPIAGSSLGTLDQAYDYGSAGNGRIITADAGAVTIEGNDGFVSTGTLNTGALAPTGTGVKMYWNPRKAAFRAGRAFSNRWDDANVGQYSIAFGTSTIASGQSSTAFGTSTIASGFGSTAFGDDTNALGVSSTAFGGSTTALGNFSTAFGITTFASGSWSTAFGREINAAGNTSTSFGRSNSAPSYAETVIGIGATNYTPTSNGDTQFGTANATDRLFVIGSALDFNSNDIVDFVERRDAMIVLKNGLTRLPSTTNAMITAADGKAVVTKEYLLATIPSNNDWSLIGNTGTNPTTDFLGTNDNQSLAFRTDSTERMRLTSTGRLGIGTTSPEAVVEVNGANVITTPSLEGNLFINSNDPQNIDLGGSIALGGSINSTATLSRVFGTIEGRKSSNVENNGAGYLVFKTNNGNFLSLFERMRITSDGDVGIGTATPGGQFELSLNEGRKPGTTTWTVVSDARLKNVLGNYTKGLTEILQLNPVLYKYKNGGGRIFEEEVLNTPFSGFLAQEVQTLFPEAVGTDEDGFLNLDIHSILIASINAIKELDKKNKEQQIVIEQLQIEVSSQKALEEKMEVLFKRIETLESANR